MVLWAVLLINFGFFIVEMGAGLIANSMGLIADSLDMLADSFVYGLALLAVGASVLRKKQVAKWSGYLQAALAIIGLLEVLRRFLGLETPPDYEIMIVVATLALLANVTCLYLLKRSQGEDAHMQASMIFTSNDIWINAGVVVAAVLVLWSNSNLPDLMIGLIVFLIVIRGAFRILKIAK